MSPIIFTQQLWQTLFNGGFARVAAYNEELLITYIYHTIYDRAIPINQAILKAAASIRSTKNLKTPDAIHAATALNLGCTIFLTNDAGLRNVPALSVVVLKDVLNS